MSKKERIKWLESENDSILTQCRAMGERIDGLKKDLQKMAADLEAAKSNSIDQIDPEKLAGALIEQAWITDVKPGAPEFNDLVSALGCNLWDKRYAVTSAEPEECVHDFIPFTSQCSKCGEPFKSEPEACPTCGEEEAFSGSCGTGKDDTQALCRRNAPVEPVGIINAIKKGGCSGFEAIIYATAIFEDRIADGALIYTEPGALKGENELLRTELEKYQALYGAALVDLRDAKAEIEILREEVKRLTTQVEEGLPRLMQQCHDLRAEREALKADAERYRHIRENADTMHWENMLKTDIETLEDIDAAIDAARTAKPEVDHGEVSHERLC